MNDEIERADKSITVTITFLEDDLRLIAPAMAKTKLSLERFAHIGAMKLAATWVLQTFSHIEAPDMHDLARMAMTEARVAHWDDELQLTFTEELMHLQAELAEAFEAWRLYQDYEVHTDPETGKLEGVPIEFADILLGLFYNVALHDINIVKALADKHAYNLTRDYRAEGRQLHRKPHPMKPTMRIVDATTVTGVGEDDFTEAFQEAVDGGAFQVQSEPEHRAVTLMNALEESIAIDKAAKAEKDATPDGPTDPV